METVTQLDQLIKNIQIKLNDALSSLTHRPANLQLNQWGLMRITEAQTLLKNIPGHVTAVYIPIIDKVTGDIFVFLPGEMANNIADYLIGNDPGTTNLVGEFESSALKEFGNITFGAIVTEIANTLKIPMMLTVPNLATDMANALLDQVLIEYGEKALDMLAIQMPFTLGDSPLEGTFLILFDRESSDLISSKMAFVDNGENHEGGMNGAR